MASAPVVRHLEIAGKIIHEITEEEKQTANEKENRLTERERENQKTPPQTNDYRLLHSDILSAPVRRRFFDGHHYRPVLCERIS